MLPFTDVPPTDVSDYPGYFPEETQSLGDGRFFWIPYKGCCSKLFTETKMWADACVSCMNHGESLQDWLGQFGCNCVEVDSEHFSFCQGASLVSTEDPSEQEFTEMHMKVFDLFKKTRGYSDSIFI